MGRTRVVRAVAWSLLALAGCGGEGREEDAAARYVPEPAIARKTLVDRLEEWRAGRDPSSDNVVDKHRRPGQRLVGYEILGEVSAETGRGFAARLTLEHPDEEQVVRFLLIGVEPIWVFRQEDYELISHWMHKMDEPPAGDASP